MVALGEPCPKCKQPIDGIHVDHEAGVLTVYHHRLRGDPAIPPAPSCVFHAAPPTEAEQAAALSQLEEAMRRWGVKPEQLGPQFRELMAFTPTAVPDADSWIDQAADEIAGDPSCCDISSSDAGRIADIIRGHVEAARKRER